ncbi:EpsG family protein [Limosilactobacillus pontis]|uniref:EpsG family protein n=1 Tax=Limosilactobacillus pontis TaxID=35787 RepID=A0ABU7SUD2_9LACO
MNVFLTFILYGFIILLFPYFVNLSLKQKRNTKTIALVLISFLCALVATFRGNSGTDTSMYRTLYNFGEASITRWVSIEPGYMFLNNIFKGVGVSSNLFFGFLNLLTTFFVLLSIDREKNKVNVYVSSLIYFSTLYFQSFNIMRQALAVAICLYAICLYLDNTKVASVTLILIATLIHRSAIISLAIIVAKFMFEKRNSKLLIIISVAILMLLVLDRNLFGKIILTLTGSQYYASYVLRNSGSRGSFLLYYVKLLPILLISFLEIKNYKHSPNITVMFALMLFGYILSSLGVFTSTDINRLGMYFSTCDILVMGYCANHNISVGNLYIKKNLLIGVILIYFILVFFIQTFILGYYEIVPYHNMDIVYSPFV